tara:strand:+ start:581 stop:1153 length:573 start_codon:yes stop_codon:yes gene_type:complete
MSSIKLTADSGGGTFEIKAPSSSGNTRVLTLPDTGDLTLGKTGILQVAQTFKNDTQSIAATGAYTLIQGLGTTMTLSNSSNKILVNIHLTAAQSASNYAVFRLYDGSSAITAAHSTGASSYNTSLIFYLNANQASSYVNASFSFLYSPGDTNAHTINLYGNPFNTTIYINRSNNTNSYGTSSMTLMEVAA